MISNVVPFTKSQKIDFSENHPPGKIIGIAYVVYKYMVK